MAWDNALGTYNYSSALSGTAATAASTGGYGTVMAAGMVANMFSSIASSIVQSNALKAQAKYQQQQDEFNAKMADLEGQEAIADGERSAQAIERQGRAAVASTRVASGAAGIEINSGSSMDVQETQRTMSALDALTERNNATRRAFGYQVQALNSRGNGEMGQLTAQAQSTSTLLTGGLNAVVSGAQGYYYGTGGSIKDTRKSW